jgi:hypothetical protein
MRIEARESPSWPEQSSAAGYITADCQRPTRKNPLADGGRAIHSERTIRYQLFGRLLHIALPVHDHINATLEARGIQRKSRTVPLSICGTPPADLPIHSQISYRAVRVSNFVQTAAFYGQRLRGCGDVDTVP